MKITFTAGCMGAGKSKNLIKFYRDETDICHAFAAHLSKPTGLKGKIESRNGQKIEATYLNKDDDDGILKIIENYAQEGFDRFFIDEIQFLSKKVIKGIIEIAESYNISIHFYGLLTTFTDEYFESSEYILRNINRKNVLYLSRFCDHEDCPRIANHNGRIINGKVKRKGDTFLEEKSSYMALCSFHYFL